MIVNSTVKINDAEINCTVEIVGPLTVPNRDQGIILVRSLDDGLTIPKAASLRSGFAEPPVLSFTVQLNLPQLLVDLRRSQICVLGFSGFTPRQGEIEAVRELCRRVVLAQDSIACVQPARQLFEIDEQIAAKNAEGNAIQSQLNKSTADLQKITNEILALENQRRNVWVETIGSRNS